MAGLFDKAKDFLNSDQGEKTSDSVLDKAAAAADKVTGGKHTDTIAQAREQADEHLGRDDASDRPRTTDPTASDDRM